MSKVTRRDFFKLAVAGAVVSACTPVLDEQVLAPEIITAPDLPAPDPIVHLLNRATFGATPQTVADVQAHGIETWLESQFDYTNIRDLETIARLRRFNTLSMTSADLLSFARIPDRVRVSEELAGATITRAVYSERQLYEKMVHFWSDHFSIYYFKDTTSQLQTVDDRDVIRPHALGNFGDMLRASAHSPAMLVYLDNVVNELSHPNENYAREIMELHTLGVDGAYTEEDVYEVARCFTGWSVSERGVFQYRSEWHDEGEKTVLGHTIPANGGKADGDRVLDILTHHPDTARYLARKLLVRFVEDEPSEALVQEIATVWINSQGHIPTVMRAIFAHDAFWQAPPKFKRPLELVLSMMRVLGARYNGGDGLVTRLAEMGQRPFGNPMPDGYPDIAREWLGNFLPRWNFVLDVMQGNQPTLSLPINQWVTVAENDGLDGIARAILLRPPTQAERDAVLQITGENFRPTNTHTRIALAVLLSSPAFQWR
ncbi:MAG: DUF1800 domain-containing protein [Chloroflexota bacterium]